MYAPPTKLQIRRLGLLAVVLVAIADALPKPARAADTVESWDPGAANIEAYAALEGVGRSRAEASVTGDMLAGYGLVRGLGAYLSTTVSADGHLTERSSELGFGLLSTPLDSEPWDLDLMLDVRSAGNGSETLLVSPSAELNWDRAPDLAAWGLYTRAGLCMSRVETTGGAASLTDVCLAVGGYYALTPRAQLLLEIDAEVADRPGDAPSEFRAGGVNVGYNLVISDTLEWLQQVRVNIPDTGETSSVSYLVGLIATLPTS